MVALDRRKASGFPRWLFQQRTRDDPVGDLARDALMDGSFPQTGTDPDVFENHLVRLGACYDARVAMDGALAEFRHRGK